MWGNPAPSRRPSTDSASYAHAFESLGHEATVGWANNAPLQVAWAKEHGYEALARAVERARPAVTPRRFAQRIAGRWKYASLLLRRGAEDSKALTDIYLSQIESFRPDVVLNQDMFLVGRSALRHIRSLGIKVVGQHAASRLPANHPDRRLRPAHLLVSSDRKRSPNKWRTGSPQPSRLRSRRAESSSTRPGTDPLARHVRRKPAARPRLPARVSRGARDPRADTPDLDARFVDVATTLAAASPADGGRNRARDVRDTPVVVR